MKRRRAAVSVRENRDVILESFSPNYKFKDPAKRSGFINIMDYTINNKENYCDFLVNEKKITRLVDIGMIPVKFVEETSSCPLPIHMNMMYRHVDWDNFDIVLDEQMISRLYDILSEEEEEAFLETLKPDMRVMLVDRDEMKPISYSQMQAADPNVEVVTYDRALSFAALCAFRNISGHYEGFKLATAYFLMAFRLAMLDGEMSDKDRFSYERYQKVWNEAYSTFLFRLGVNVTESALDLKHREAPEGFALDEYDALDYQRYAKAD